MQWQLRVLEGAKKRYSGSGVSEYVTEMQEAGDLVGRGMAFLDGVGWMGFAGIKGEEGLGEGRVYPGRGAEGVESVTSMGEDTCTSGLIAYKEDTGWWNEVNISPLTVRSHGKRATHIVSVMSRGREASRGRWSRVVGMRGSRQSRTRHPRLNSRSGGGIWCGRWSITNSNTPTRPVCQIRLPREGG